MSKNIPQEGEVASSKYFEGTNDSTIVGASPQHIEIRLLLDAAEKQLAGDSPDLEVIQLKRILEETLQELPSIEGTSDAHMRSLKEQEVLSTLESARLTLELVARVPKVKGKDAKSTLLITPDWDNEEKPLN